MMHQTMLQNEQNNAVETEYNDIVDNNRSVITTEWQSPDRNPI